MENFNSKKNKNEKINIILEEFDEEVVKQKEVDTNMDWAKCN